MAAQFTAQELRRKFENDYPHVSLEWEGTRLSWFIYSLREGTSLHRACVLLLDAVLAEGSSEVQE